MRDDFSPGSGFAWPNSLITIFFSLFFIAAALSLFGSLLPSELGGFSAQRVFLCVLVVSFSLAGVGLLSVRVSAVSRNVLPISLLLCILGLVVGHAIFSNNPFRWVEPGLYAGFLMSTVLLGLGMERMLSCKSIIGPTSIIVGVLTFLYGVMGLNYYWFSLSEPSVDISEFLPWGFVNIRYWSHLATWLLPLLPIALMSRLASHSKLWKFLVAFGGASWVWMLILSSARGTVVSLLLGIFFASLIFRRSLIPWLKQFGLFVLWGVILWMFLSVLIPAFFGIDVEGHELRSGGSGRLILWQESFAMSLQNFPFGLGPQAWLYHEPLIDGYRASKAFGHPHNMYLMWAAEYGWLFVLYMLSVFVWLGVRLLKRYDALGGGADSRSELVLCGFTVSVTSALCHAGVSSVFLAPASMLVGLFVLIIFCAILKQPESEAENQRFQFHPHYPARFAFFVVVGLMLSFFWFKEVIDYHQAMLEDFPVYFEQRSSAHFPRFWYHGYFPRADSF